MDSRVEAEVTEAPKRNLIRRRNLLSMLTDCKGEIDFRAARALCTVQAMLRALTEDLGASGAL